MELRCSVTTTIGVLRVTDKKEIFEFFDVTSSVARINTIDVITNGTLELPEEFRAPRFRNKVYIQITFDGDEYFHNKTRQFKGGNGSFKTIMTNLARAIGAGYNIMIRINVTSENASSIEALLDNLRPFVGQNITLNFALIESTQFSEVDSKVDGSQIRSAVSKAIGMGFCVLPPTNRKNCKFCSRGNDRPSGIILDGKGNLYSCLDSCGQPNLEVGNIEDGYSGELLRKNWKSCGYQSLHHESSPYSFNDLKELYYKKAETRLLQL